MTDSATIAMEERAVLANITTIITKDLLIDEPPKHTGFFSNNYPLLDGSDDDEAEIFALMQQKRAAGNGKGNLKRKQSDPPASEQPKARNHEKVAKLEWKYAELNLLHRYVDAQFESFLHMRKLTFLVS